MPGPPGQNRWVTKTDITRYIRCPYAFWVLYKGMLSFAESITPLQAGLIERGVAFQDQVEAQAEPLVEDVDLPTLFARSDLTLYGLPLLVNKKLGFRGVPDGVCTEGGALVPIEMKSHRDVLPSDRLELAFYWLLLAPYRTQRHAQPRGVVILSRDGGEVEAKIDLLPRHFADVTRIVAEVRRARRYGVESRFCSCSVCAGPMREEVLRRAHQGKDLTLIWKIGRRYAEELEALGVASYSDLLDCDQALIVARLRASKLSVSAAMVEGWCRHAESYARAEAIMFGAPTTLPRSFMALDLEYGPSRTWLTGVCVVDGGRRELVQLWADTAAEERRNLRQLARLVEDNPTLPLVTWNGAGADLPELRKAGKRLRVAKLVEAILRKHVDLFRVAAAGVRLPVPRLSLAEVGAYFGVKQLSTVGGGFDAQMRYLAYFAAGPGPSKAALRDELLEYNRDDLIGLVAVAEGFGRLAAAAAAAAAAPAVAPCGVAGGHTEAVIPAESPAGSRRYRSTGSRSIGSRSIAAWRSCSVGGA